MFAAIFIPEFLLQAVLRHEPELRSQPVALVDPELPGAEIVQITSSAADFGIVAGLTASQAMARCAHLVIKTRSRTQEKTATEILLQTAYAFSPHIESTAPGVCTMELKGLAEATAGGDALQAWSEKILHTLARLHLDARVGVAATPALALLATHGNKAVSFVQDTTEFVSHLPVAALEPAPEISEILARWGIRIAGEFLALGKNEIAERLGPRALALFDRVAVDLARPLKLVALPETFSEEMEFEHEIETAEPLLFVLRRFVEQLARRLDAIYLVVAEFQLRLGLASGAKHERTFKIPDPTGNVVILFRMLQTHLETVRTDSPIISLQLSAIPAKPGAHQFGLFESTLRNPNQFAETMARLTALVGAENVGSPVLEATHKPDSFRMTVPDFDKIERGNPGVTAGTGAALRRFRPPLPAHFEFREEKPALIRSEIFTGPIANSRGPFFSSGHWWDDRRWAREEWDVQTVTGSMFRIFRSPEGSFVEGVYD